MSGELDFNHIKMMLTPFEFVDDLKTKLAKLRLPTSIQVLGFAPINIKQVDIVVTEDNGKDSTTLSYW
jgi:hypothetical protein